MHALAAAVTQRHAKLLARGAEGDGVEAGAVGGFEPHPHMGLADLLGIRHRMRRQRNHRLGIARAERPGAFDHRDKLGVRRGGRDRAVDHQPAGTPRRFHIGAERGFKKCAQLRERAFAQGDAGRHGVAAALEQKPFGHGAAHRAADIDAGDGAARAGADAAGLERDGKSGTAEFLLQSSRNDADDSGMPAFGGGHDDGALFLKTQRRTGLGFGLRQSSLFDRLALLIEPIELAGDLGGFDRIVFEQKSYAEIGAADASAGIDPRPEQKTEMPRFRRPGKPRDVHQADMA